MYKNKFIQAKSEQYYGDIRKNGEKLHQNVEHELIISEQGRRTRAEQERTCVNPEAVTQNQIV